MNPNNKVQNPYYNNPTSMNQQQEPTAQVNTSTTQQNPYYASPTYQQPTQQVADTSTSIFDSIDTGNLVKGALVGAIGAYLLTNENAQKTIFKTIVKGTEMFEAGIEEMKERFEDAKAEIEAER